VGKEGTFLLEVLNEAGVDTGCVAVAKEGATGHAIIQNDSEGDNCIILFGGTNHRIGRAQVDRVLAHFAAGDFIILQNEISELAYIIRQAHERGMTVAFNPSPMEPNVLQLPLDMIDYFLVNEVEAAALSNSKGEADSILMCLAEKFTGAKIVMTLGEKGSIYWDGRRIYRQEAVKAAAVDTTAAGDTYTGYFISGIIRGEKTEEILFRASVASAISVTRQGASPSIPERKEVEAMIKTSERKTK